MGRAASTVIQRSTFASVLSAGLFSLFLLTGLDDSDSPASRAVYDSYLRFRSFLQTTPYADPFLVVFSDISQAENPGTDQTADLLDLLGRTGIRTALFTAVFRSESISDARLAEAARGLPEVVFGGVCAGSGTLDDAPLWTIPGRAPDAVPSAAGYFGSAKPLSGFASGFLNLAADSDDVVRRIPLVYRAGDRFIPSAALVGALSALRLSERGLEWVSGRALRFSSGLEIPVDRKGCVLLDFPSGWDGAFFTYRTGDVLRKEPREAAVRALRQELRDSAAVVMDAGPGSPAFFAPGARRFPAAAAIPIFINQALKGTFVKETPRPARLVSLGLLSALVGAGTALSFRRRYIVWLIPLLSAVSAYVGAGAVFVLSGVFINPAPFLFVCVCAAAVGSGRLYILWSRSRAEAKAEIERERLFAELGRQSAGITHGLRGQASLAASIVRLLETEKLSARGEQGLQLLSKSIEELSRSLNAVTALARVGSREPATVDAAAVLRGFILVYSGVGDRPPTGLAIRDEPVKIRSIGDDLIRVLEVFHTNAHESYSRTAKPEERNAVEIELRREGGAAVLEIRDRGDGIPECRGCRAERCMTCGSIRLGKTGKENGSGYGLFWARNVIKRNGAAFRVICGEMGGTIIRVTWPLENRENIECVE